VAGAIFNFRGNDMNSLKWLALGITVCCGALLLAAPPAVAEEPALKLETDSQKLSYVLGMNIGASLKRLGPSANLDLTIVMQAVKDVMDGKPTLLNEQEANEIRTTFAQKMQEWMAAEVKARGEKNRAEGEAFLAQNKTRPGVVTTASGLQYEVITQGIGDKPKETDTVTVNYRGTLIDGTEFDSSARQGKPVSFPVKGVIPGWTEALQMMPVGSKYRVYIPGNLAYGERSAGRLIGPQSTLIFEVELVSIAPAQAQPVPPATAAPVPETPAPPAAKTPQ
jgi:FKBP-type peptidyl-prolyl cis-trans isomerase